MHRWQLASAAIRRRSCQSELSRVNEGIAASLRHFHNSIVVRADSDSSNPISPPTRRSASAQAAADISKLAATPAANGAPEAGQPRVLKRRTVPARGGGQQGGALSGRGGAPKPVGAGQRGSSAAGRGGQRGRRGGGQNRRSRDTKNEERSAEENEEGTSQMVREEQEEMLQSGLPWEVIEAQKSHFRSEAEMQEYANLMGMVERISLHKKAGEETLAEAEIGKDEDTAKDARRLLKDVDQALEEALQSLQRTMDRIHPVHTPQVITPHKLARREIGLVPVGEIGMGGVVEEAIRYAAKREGHKYEDPGKLAAKLVAGEVVKFRNVYERDIVLRLARARTPINEDGKKTKYQVLTHQAKRELVESIVSGSHKSPADQQYQGTDLERVARILGNNASYAHETKNLVLETINSMLPSKVPQAVPKASKASA